MNDTIITLILYFFTYAFLGWVLESTFKSIRDRRFVNSGFLLGPFVPIYGFAAILLTQTSAACFPLLAQLNLIVRILIIFLSIAAITSLLEYCTGALLEALFQAKWWDYSDERFHIKGRVSLKYSVFWGWLGYFTLQFVQPLVKQCLENSSFDLKYGFALLIMVYLPFDIVICLRNLGKLPTAVPFKGLLFFHNDLNRGKQMLVNSAFLSIGRNCGEVSTHRCNEAGDIFSPRYNQKSPGQYQDQEDFAACIDDLISHPLIQKMKQFRHHQSTSCFHHSLNVAYSSYRLCKTLGWDYKAAARGGMLHDLFLYDWRTTTLANGRHGFVHPQIALDNASGVSVLNDLEKDIILKHMFPLTWRPPSYKESLLVCLVDKYWAVKELLTFGKSSDRCVKNSHIPFPGQAS